MYRICKKKSGRSGVAVTQVGREEQSNLSEKAEVVRLVQEALQVSTGLPVTGGAALPVFWNFLHPGLRVKEVLHLVVAINGLPIFPHEKVLFANCHA